MLPERRKARATLGAAEAAAKRNPSPEQQERVDALRRDYRALALEEHILTVVDAAPPLTDEQRIRLAQLLRPTAGDGRPPPGSARQHQRDPQASAG